MESLFGIDIVGRVKSALADLANVDDAEKIRIINEIKLILHDMSPFKEEPVDCVIWVPGDTVVANNYNPNNVAPPEMRLLEISIAEDGYTQPVVTWKSDGHHEVVDGFHRTRVGKESKSVKKRTRGYLPVTIINSERLDRGDRIASTIRHNRARGKHQVQAMCEIIIELKRRMWTDEKIGLELGMEADEVLRLSQISGLAEMFVDKEFSEAWEIDL